MKPNERRQDRTDLLNLMARLHAIEARDRTKAPVCRELIAKLGHHLAYAPVAPAGRGDGPRPPHLGSSPGGGQDGTGRVLRPADDVWHLTRRTAGALAVAVGANAGLAESVTKPFRVVTAA